MDATPASREWEIRHNPLVGLCLIYGQATKGVWWMPRGKEPKKGAVSGEMLRGGANIH